MKICYLGTGAAEGIPALFCQCEFCKGARARGETRTRAQALLDGELSIDFPPDVFFHAARSRADFSAIRYLLVTHSHEDHFFAGDLLLRGYKYARDMTERRLDLFAGEEVLEIFHEVTRRELRPEIAGQIVLHTLSAFVPARFGGWTAHPLKAKHSSRDPFVFFLEKEGKRVLHLHDSGLLPDEDYAYLEALGGRPADLITFDCTFLYETQNEHARHMGLAENAEVLRRLEEIGFADGHTKRVITHFSHNSAPTPAQLARAEAEYGVIAAFDGMELEI